jgi:hypothetical protein
MCSIEQPESVGLGILRKRHTLARIRNVQIFLFAIRGRDDSRQEETGCMTPSDDGAALAFGKQMIRDMT